MAITESDELTIAQQARKNIAAMFKERTIETEECSILLSTSNFVFEETGEKTKRILTHLKVHYPYILGDILFGLHYENRAELLYQYERIALIKDPRGGKLIVREIYQTPDGLVFRAQKGSREKPKEAVYASIDAESMRKTLKREIWRCGSDRERKSLRSIIREHCR